MKLSPRKMSARRALLGHGAVKAIGTGFDRPDGLR